MEIETRRILHFNVTRHPNAEWTLQQFRECICGDEGYRFLIQDRDSIYSRELDASLKSLGVPRTEDAVQISPGECFL